MITSQTEVPFIERGETPGVDVADRWHMGDSPMSIQERPLRGRVVSVRLAAWFREQFLVAQDERQRVFAESQALAGNREALPPTREPLEFHRGDRIYSHLDLVGKVGSGTEYLYVIRTEDANPDDSDGLLCFFADYSTGRVSEPDITDLGANHIRFRTPVFRDGDRDERYVDRVLEWGNQPESQMSLKTRSSEGLRWHREIVTEQEKAMDQYEKTVQGAADFGALLDQVSDPKSVAQRRMLDEFMLNVVGHRNPDVRRLEGLPGNDYMQPVVMGFTAGENEMTIAIRNRGDSFSVKPEDYQVTVGNLDTGRMGNGHIYHLDRTRDGRIWIDVLVNDQVVHFNYLVTEAGAAYDVHCSIDGGATANDNVRPIAELVDGIEDRMGSSLGEVVAIDRLSDRFAKLITTNSNAARVLDGFASKYAGSLARDGSSYHSEDLPVIEGSESHDTVIGTVFLGVDGEPGGRVCHIRCNRADGVGDRPEDYVVDIADLHDVFDLNLDAGVEVNWLSTEIDDRGRTILRIGFNLIDLGDVQVSCVLDENGQGSEFSIHKLNRRLGPLPTLNRVLERVQYIEQERRERDGGDVGRRAVDAALVAA